jgi:NAD(P)-dependent dehydrogenase (short-subunit alcohol dehydrogenase family)
MTEPLPVAPSQRLDGRRALVTGAGRGLGQAAAAALAAAGAAVTLVARTVGEIEALRDQLRARGDTAEAHALDATDVTAVAAFINAGPSFDILVNNAGTNRPKPMGAVGTDDYDTVMDPNVRAAFFLAQAVARRLVGAGRPGSIINVTSQMGHVGAVDRVLYCTSKWALEGMNKAMAVEFAPAGIRVNAIAPTFVETAMTATTLSDPAKRDWAVSNIPMGRLARVEDVMGAVVYLASDASAMVTGTSLLIDGGWTAQ